ncbi:MAG: ribonuclease III [Clostridia bacterium]|nr:ribonuclease III [Clostridia bacterium]
MEKFFRNLGYSFHDMKLLNTALTHPSYGSDHHTNHYQRMEFLGDAVLELAVSRYLYQELPHVAEGKLTRIRAALVREETLADAARRLDIGRLIRLSVGEERSGGREKNSILSDVMEAVIAAVYLDGGLEAATALVYRALEEPLHRVSERSDALDDKSRLQEILQRDGRMPTYEFISMDGPAHAPTFRYRVLVDGRDMGEGRGNSKQAAQQAAAASALSSLATH